MDAPNEQGYTDEIIYAFCQIGALDNILTDRELKDIEASHASR